MYCCFIVFCMLYVLYALPEEAELEEIKESISIEIRQDPYDDYQTSVYLTRFYLSVSK